MISPSQQHPFSNYANPAIWGSVTCLRILTDDYRKLTSGNKVIISHLTDRILPALPIIMLIYNSGPLLPALGILTDDYCKLTSRYKAIISHLTDMISPALPVIMLIYNSGPLLPALRILTDDYCKLTSRYKAIISHLTDTILGIGQFNPLLDLLPRCAQPLRRQASSLLSPSLNTMLSDPLALVSQQPARLVSHCDVEASPLEGSDPLQTGVNPPPPNVRP